MYKPNNELTTTEPTPKDGQLFMHMVYDYGLLHNRGADLILTDDPDLKFLFKQQQNLQREYFATP